MKNNSISVIVPMYRAAGLLSRGIASLKKQSGDFEVLLIDDGSPDDTLAEAKNLIGGDLRFRVIAEEHRGTAAAVRNRGIELATGDYLYFMDADDELEPDALSEIAAALTRHERLDVLSCGYCYGKLDGNGEWVSQGEKRNLRESAGVVSGAEMLSRLYRAGQNLVCNSYAAVCRREFLVENHLRQNESLRLFEDNEWLPRVIFKAERIGALDRTVYRYIRRRGSMSTTLDGAALLSVAESSRGLAEFLDANYAAMGRDVRRFWSNHTLNGFLWYYLNPRYRGCFSRADRRAAKRAGRLFRGRIGWRLFLNASIKKKLAWPLLAIF